jgi:carbon-monoxide dehydrogenase small subunit
MITFTVNGEQVSVDTPGARRLLDVLREELDMTGTKEGCGEGECGACSVLIDREVVNSCLVAVGQVEGCEVMTVEGLERDGVLTALQQAFIDCGAAQCGICTPGMLMAAHALLRQNPDPTEQDVRTAIGGNLCRCTGYTKIIEAIQACRTHAS